MNRLRTAAGRAITVSVLATAPALALVGTPTGAHQQTAVVYANVFGIQGGHGDDGASGVKVDAAGDAYVVGTTTSGLSHKAIFVTKFDPSGTRKLYTTLLSGGCDSEGGGIALDATGNAYVTGLYTSKDENGICDVTQVVVAKLGTGGTPLYNVRFGEHKDLFARDWGNSIAVDRGGNAYVTGTINGDSQFPTTPGAFMPHGPGLEYNDGFVLKVDGTGRLVYSTVLGGSDLDHGAAIAVDRQGDAYVTGQTASKDFPVTPNAYQRHPGSSGDLGSVFVAKLNPSGSALLYSTYLDGMAAEGGTAITVDAQGRAYVTGATASPNFPTTPGAYSRGCGPDGHCGLSVSDQALCGSSGTCSYYDDAFVSEIDPNPALPARATLVYSTYLGGTLGDSGAAIGVDSAHHVDVAGMTGSTDFPTMAATQPERGDAHNALNPNNDAFVAKLDLTQRGHAALLFSTYLGGKGGDAAGGIAIGHAGTIYVAGTTGSADFPAHGHPAGGSDAFLVKFNLAS